MKHIIRNNEDKFNILSEYSQIDIVKPMQLEISEYSPKKSLSQNGLFHVLVDQITKNMNKRHPTITFNKEFIKTELKRRLGIVEYIFSPVTEEDTHYLKSIADYTREELNILITKTLVWGCDMSIDLSTMGCKEYDQYREAAQ